MQNAANESIYEFQTKILQWYVRNKRKFPWREKGLSDYAIIISEILLQRTKAENVSVFYSGFISEFPNWQSLSKTKLTKIENYLRPIGLYKQRALRLKKLATEVVRRGGEIPHARHELEELPFIGQYIANAIELLVFQKPKPLLDVNMARVLERCFGERKLADIRYDPYLQNLAFTVVHHVKSKELNWGILDFAALICKAKSPRCQECFFADKCVFFNMTKSQ